MSSITTKRKQQGKAWGAVRIPHTIHPILMSERHVASGYVLQGVYLTEDEARVLRDELSVALED